MTLIAVTLTRRNVHQLDAITPTPGAPWWAAEVETFLVEDTPKQIDSRTGSGFLVQDGNVLVTSCRGDLLTAGSAG